MKFCQEIVLIIYIEGVVVGREIESLVGRGLVVVWCFDRWVGILIGREILMQVEDGVYMYKNRVDGLRGKMKYLGLGYQF